MQARAGTGLWRALVPAASTALSVCAVAGAAAAAASAAAGWKALVGAQNGVTPLNTATNATGKEIRYAGASPNGMAITPNGRTAYVVNFGNPPADGSVRAIDLATGTAGRTITVGEQPNAIAIAPDGKAAYVVNNPSAGPGSVTPIDLATAVASTAIPVGDDPDSIAVAPDGKYAYVGNNDDGTVSVIDLATNTVTDTIDGLEAAGAIAIAPNGRTAFVITGTGSAGAVTPIDLATNTPGKAIPVGDNVVGLSIAPDGDVAYAVHSLRRGTLTPIDLAKHGHYRVRLTVVDTAGTSLSQVFTGQTMSRHGGPSATVTHSVAIASQGGRDGLRARVLRQAL